VTNLPFRDATFDLVTAVETHYYWPDLHADMQEIRRVLRPGGALAVIVEAYKGGKHDQMLKKVAQLRGPSEMKLTLLTASEHRELLVEVGYSDVRVVEAYEKGWLCAVGCTGAQCD
jgi:SAM-dependent methyltransferase